MPTASSSVRRQEASSPPSMEKPQIHTQRRESPANALPRPHHFERRHSANTMAMTLTAAGSVIRHAADVAVDGSRALLANVTEVSLTAVAANITPPGLVISNGPGSSAPDVHPNLYDVPDDIFPAGRKQLTWTLVEESAPKREWLTLLITCIVLSIIDRYVMQSSNRCNFIHHMGNFAYWILAGLAYGLHYSYSFGRENGIDWFFGYVLEWVLSLDNLFVLHMVMTSFRVPDLLQHQALFCAIAGAMLTRLCLFVILGYLIHLLDPVRVIFGMILIWSGVSTLQDDDDDINPDDFIVVRFVKLFAGSRMLSTFDPEGKRVFTRDENGRLCATLLVPVILSIEVVDVLFAVDSISAKVAQIHNVYITFSSSVMAMFGLRAAYFIIRDMVDYFALLKYGICFILVFIGIELVASPWIELPSSALLAVILAVFVASVLASVTNEASLRRQREQASEHVCEVPDDDGSAAQPEPSAAANPQSDEVVEETVKGTT